jgi:polyhydroxyalkanoate synthesis regulator phasin
MSNLEQRPIDQATANPGPIGSPRNFVLACIGLLSLLADEIPALLERSVQRGNDVLERAQREAKQRRAAPPDVVQPISHEVQTELSHLGLPTHQDFAMLLQQVNELEQQIDRIAEERSVAAH